MGSPPSDAITSVGLRQVRRFLLLGRGDANNVHTRGRFEGHVSENQIAEAAGHDTI
jgi:hypothetical protein